MKALLIAFCLLLSFSSIAAKYTGAAKITGFSNINSNGNFYIMGEWDAANTDGCTNTEKWLVGTHAALNTAESVSSAMNFVMAAYMASKTIELYVDGCNSAGQPIVASIWLPSRN